MGQMRETGLFSDSENRIDPYMVIYVETNVETPDLFQYLWDYKDVHYMCVQELEIPVESDDPTETYTVITKGA